MAAVNVNGGAIALGHPLAIAVTTLAEAEAPAVDEMVLVAFDDETQRRYEGLLAQGP